MIAGSMNLLDELKPYRCRLRTLLAWRWGAMGGILGVLLAIALDLMDWFEIAVVEPYWLPAAVAAGVLMGVGYALLRPLPPEAVAAMIDRRGGLKDRVQTALERSQAEGVFDEPLIEDALHSLSNAKPAGLFKLRFGQWQGAFVGALVLMILIHYLPVLPFFVSDEEKKDRQAVQSLAKQVEEVAKPVLEQAKKPGAKDIQKQLARNVELFNRSAQKGRLDKKQAMIKYNQILAQAKKLEEQNRKDLQQASFKAANAAEQLQKAALKNQQLDRSMQDLQQRMAQLQKMQQTGKNMDGKPLSPQQQAAMQNELQNLQRTMQAMRNPSDAQAIQDQIANLKQQMKDLQNQLQSGKNANGVPLSKEAMDALKQQMKQLQEQMKALELSKEAQEFMRKLMNDPNFIEAMKKLQELAKQAQNNANQQDPQQQKLSQEEIERMAKELQQKLEELAKKYNSDEKIKQLAEQLKQQVEQMKEMACQNGACAGLGALGLGPLAMSPSSSGRGGAWDKGDWFGQPENFNQGEKQPQLKIPMKNTPVRGQNPLMPGPADYQEFNAPPTPGDSSIPLSQVLPSYQKSAENAMNKQDIPPAERKRVKKYFDSLKGGQ